MTQPPEIPNPTQEQQDEKAYQQMVSSTNPIKMLLPILIGVGFMVYVFWGKVNLEQLKTIDWSPQAFFWIAMAALFMALRHFFYMVRLRLITDGVFSWKKLFQLIMIWEFSSAVTPTSVGGSAVSMFVLTREKIPGGKSAMIVLYTVVIDTFFYLMMLGFYLLFFGKLLLEPKIDPTELVTLKTAFWTAYLLMFTYGSIFFYGVLISPKGLQKFFILMCKIPFLRRFEAGALKLTNDMALASAELRQKNWKFHLGAIFSTMGAWTCRYLVFNFLAMGFIISSHNAEIADYYTKFMDATFQGSTFMEHLFMMARQQAMYVLMAIMPTPGGAGGVEYFFLRYHHDYVLDNKSLEFVLTLLWRLLTYYVYIFFGSMVVVRWLSDNISTKKAA